LSTRLHQAADAPHAAQARAVHANKTGKGKGRGKGKD